MLKEILKEYKTIAIKVAIGWVLTSIIVVVFIAFLAIMLEYVIPSKEINLIIKLGLLYFAINILRAIATFFEDLNGEAFTKLIEADNREKIFIKLQKMKQEEIDTLRVGEILENIMNDTKQFALYYEEGICRAYIGGVMRLLGTLAILCYLNIPIVTMAFCIYIIGFGITYIYNKKSMEYTQLKRKVNAKILNWSNEQVQGYQTIKSLEIQAQRMSQINGLLVEYEKVSNRLEKNIRKYTCMYDFLVSFILVINLLIGSIGVELGFLSYGAVIVLSRYISSPESYAKWFIEGFQIRNLGRVTYEKIQTILKKEEEDIDIGEELEKVETIEFKDVAFRYGKQQVLENISLKVHQGQSIALVGRTGSGKTSFVNLICRFYEPQEGIIQINGKDYTKYSMKSLRNKIGYIMQRVVIIDGTILENINYANKKISKEKIIEICERLHLHDKIMQLKEGYETKINKDTTILSEGEKQVLNFARVMVEDPDIIILDEATASLSYQYEMIVKQAIQEVTKGKISFIIAHRLSTIKNCDKILVLKGGNILEQGNHEELMQKKGEYFTMIC